MLPFKTLLSVLCFLFMMGSGWANNIQKNESTDKMTQNIHNEVAVLSGGCFWGMEHLFSAVNGVSDVTVGYTGGNLDNPNYHDITTGKTGHAEAIQVTYNPEKITYENILKYFFKIHDPTTLNKQGNDIGTQYRSAIFYNSLEQKNTAYNVIAAGNRSGVFGKPIVTQIIALEKFYPAEDYHQDYLEKNPYGYTCHRVREEWSF
jgi:peptide-methionine (S)-S-oxide reductase